jgi:hypothetical protein
MSKRPPGFVLFLALWTTFCAVTCAACVLQFFGGEVGSGVVSGTIAFFNISNCPDTWTEYTALRGRVPVGLVASGTLEASVGTALTNTENRAVGQHNHSFTPDVHSHTADISHGHSVSDPGHSHTYVQVNYASLFASGSVLGADTTGHNATTTTDSTGITVNNFSGTIPTSSVAATGTVGQAGTIVGTNSPYVQLLACRKN